uniref:Uncharacterized protein n=1 Tax=Anguilla anguilla TaxID=7936 RepID=A0A0E9VSD5_ANGAN
MMLPRHPPILRPIITRLKSQWVPGSSKLGDSNTVSITVTAFRRGVCKEFSTVYELTETPGRCSITPSLGPTLMT